jgi:drug/metabolite transporter (DMT)-like permease
MMILSDLTTLQRVFGMTLCSMPFWLLLSVLAFARAGLPSGGQLIQSAAVALFSGVIATILFFKATDLVKDNPRQLAVIEATQSGEVLFTLLGGVLLLGDKAPDLLGVCGIGIVVVGMIGNSLCSRNQ